MMPEEKMYTTKDIAEYFGKNIDWVHRLLFEYAIRPVGKIKVENYVNELNVYNQTQFNVIERIVNINLSRKNVEYIQTTYYIVESRLNGIELEDL